MKNDIIIIIPINDVYYIIDKMLRDKKINYPKDFRDIIVRRAVIMVIEDLGGINDSFNLRNTYLDNYAKYVHDMLYDFVLSGIYKRNMHIIPGENYYIDTIVVNDSLHILIGPE
jgi:hypothetical protein